MIVEFEITHDGNIKLYVRSDLDMFGYGDFTVVYQSGGDVAAMQDIESKGAKVFTVITNKLVIPLVENAFAGKTG